jgi:uncharacterized protein YjbI with pentapeptide repeats
MATAPWWWVPLITVIGAPLLGALLYFFVPLLRVAKRSGTWFSNPPWWVQNIFVALLVGGIVAGVSDKYASSISAEQARQATRLENLRFVRQLSSEKDVVARPFAGFDLQGQILAGLDLTGADLTVAKLQDAVLVYSQLRCRPKPVGQPGPSLTCVSLAYADLTRADLTRADLTYADLTDAILEGTNLTGADLEGAHLTRADLTDAILEGTNLTDADLTRADLEGAHLEGAHLTGADLRGVHCDEKTKWPDGFKPRPCG